MLARASISVRYPHSSELTIFWLLLLMILNNVMSLPGQNSWKVPWVIKSYHNTNNMGSKRIALFAWGKHTYLWCWFWWFSTGVMCNLKLKYSATISTCTQIILWWSPDIWFQEQVQGYYVHAHYQVGMDESLFFKVYMTAHSSRSDVTNDNNNNNNNRNNP